MTDWTDPTDPDPIEDATTDPTSPQAGEDTAEPGATGDPTPQTLTAEGATLMSVQPTVGTPTVNTKWRLDIDTSATPDTPEWAQVKGLSALQPAVNPTVQDATDYDSVGWGADAVTLRKWQVTGTAMRKRYSDAYDPGQEALRAAADDLSLVHVRFYERDADGAALADGEAYEGYALVQWEPQGGDATALSTVNFTLLGQGQRTATTVTSG